MNGSYTPSLSCYTCNEDPLPIFRFKDKSFTRDVRTYNVLIGCSSGHLTPFVIKSNISGKVLIEQDQSILKKISNFQEKYSDIISNFKKDKDLQDAYPYITKSIISNDTTGSIIHIRYFMEIHQRLRLFNLLNYPDNDNTEKMWADVKGSELYNFLLGEKHRSKALSFEKTDDSNKKFIKENKSEIESLRDKYQLLSDHIHYFRRNNKRYEKVPKKEWAIGEVISQFEGFLEIAKKIEGAYILVMKKAKGEMKNDMERGETNE